MAMYIISSTTLYQLQFSNPAHARIQIFFREGGPSDIRARDILSVNLQCKFKKGGGSPYHRTPLLSPF